MLCVPTITTEFNERIEHLPDTYTLPDNEKEPAMHIDERSKQLLRHTQITLRATTYAPRQADYKYKLNGMRNIFYAVEPKYERRRITVTKQRTKKNFVIFVNTLIHDDCPHAYQIHIICDNLNTHLKKSFLETFGTEEGNRILSRIQFHYTQKHASWLDATEIELSVLSRTAISGRIPTEEDLVQRFKNHERMRNDRQAMIK